MQHSSLYAFPSYNYICDALRRLFPNSTELRCKSTKCTISVPGGMVWDIYTHKFVLRDYSSPAVILLRIQMFTLRYSNWDPHPNANYKVRHPANKEPFLNQLAGVILVCNWYRATSTCFLVYSREYTCSACCHEF